MSLTAVLASVLLDAALGAWLGTMAFFSFVGAPRAFAVLDDDAGTYVNDVFPRYYAVGVALGVVALFAGVGLGAVTAANAALLAALGLIGVGLLLAAYSRWMLIPKMDAAGEDAFEIYHRRSVVLNAGMMLSVAAALVASHVA